VELGILSLRDLQRDQRTGRPHRAVDRMTEILGYAVLADQLGLDVFALGEHHRAEFFTASPAVVLAAAAARTTRIRLTSATTLLGVADPVRVYEDFASLDLISCGRAEVIAGRSAFVEPSRCSATTLPTLMPCSPRNWPAAGHPRPRERHLGPGGSARR
jgi:alkanesulfonate monooxygenase SsuD/methylene tetrahydromethanopterin reductase-like flavin-dependent oxidoreductase (luciferase family)